MNATQPKVNYVPGRIYSTTDYSMFGGVIGNRKVDVGHVNELMRSIIKKDLLASNPIEITKDFRIIDGQHRLEAARAFEKPIYFTISEATSLEDIQLLNTHTKLWSSKDYLDSYIQLGYKRYEVFSDFIKEFGFTIQVGLVLLANNDNSAQYKSFRSGRLEFSEEDMQQARIIADLIFELKPYFIDLSYKSPKMVWTLTQIYSKKLTEKLVVKTRVASPKYRRHDTVREYLRMFEDVINWNQKTDIVRLY